MSFRDRLVNIVKSQMNEGVDSTADIIANNIVSSFDDMGMANVTPGEFSQEEITDKENLVNTANMSNDNNFDNGNSGDSFINMAKEVMNDIVDISGDDSDVAAVEITKSIDSCDDKEHEHECECGCGHKHKGIFGESKLATIIENALGGKTCEQYMNDFVLKESNYAAPLSYVPDLRINVADVVSALKHEIGDGSEGIHVDQVYDEKRNNAYKVSQVDPNKLPKKLQVENVLLELDGDTYKVNKPSSAFPLAR